MAVAPKVEAKAFAKKYYHVLLGNPNLVDIFYMDSSLVSWAGQDGVMRHVTPMEGISDYSLSFPDAKKVDILSFDTQDSFDGALFVLVIGCMTFKNDKARKFSESFFLVPEEEEYSVLNDVFRFLDDEEAKTTNLLLSANHEPTLILFPQVVATGFVETYYHLLRERPGCVLGFYKDSSTVTWQEKDRVMGNITTIKGIFDHLISLSDAKKYDILSYNAQGSFKNGLLIVVIGCATFKNDKHKKFSQTFFLAPQKNGIFFVLNDVFSFHDDEKALKIHPGETSDPLPSTSQVPATVNYLDSKKEVNGKNPIIPVTETSCSAVQKNSKPFSISAAENFITSASQDSNLNRVNALEGTTIFVGNLGNEIEVEELSEAFKRFGTIKPNGVRSRYDNRKGGYGFIEFESPTSAQTAVQACSIRIGYQNIRIEALKPKN